MTRLERLYALNERIRRSSPAPVSAAALAREFDVSRRTIERDLAALRASGLPLFAEQGRSGGQRTLQDGRHVVFTLSASEVSALLIAVAAAGDMPYADAATAATHRLLDAIPDLTRVQVDDLRSRIRTRVFEDRKVTPGLRRTVEEAVQAQRVLNITYTDAAGVTTRRAVEPVGFYNGEKGWYLIGWCQQRNAGRIFRLDRFRSARLTTQSAPHRDVDDVLGWVPDEVTSP
ncbi:MAG: WYL domain-containing protein [Actinomycetia bacterium]|nr:WYL domain-containing protein [Actinomycetes bacterium]MCP4083444.1 WYL domain-containing protein [Actinomycetes bacterium]